MNQIKNKIACLTPSKQKRNIQPRLSQFRDIDYYFIDKINSKKELLANLLNIDLLIFYDLMPIPTIHHKEENVSIIVTWYRFLRYTYPKLKLLVIGQKDIKYCCLKCRSLENYTDLINEDYCCMTSPPKNYIDLIKEDITYQSLELVKPISSYKIIKSKSVTEETIYYENWIALDLLNGEQNINTVLEQFFNGHNNQSLLKHLTAIRQTMEIVYAELTSDYPDRLPYEELVKEWLIKYGKPEWQKLMNRWKIYRPYLLYLPFLVELKELDQLIKEVGLFFGKKFPAEEEDFLALECHHKLNRIYTILEKNIKPFVFIHEFYAKINKDKVFN